ncbi:hypothetical protein SLEP1_g14597 [Rubroshorea leprosula]|uniref:Uncharacterized protein n=1 Tax=Rubroshorea leprosula TaxID=152421 RepID=A0AAV5IW81_9ROSI|nr:hypothetical protein SLEP1_g14597 [Rubroshorea leprosula]
MARISLVFSVFLLALIFQVPSLEGRKLLEVAKKEVPSLKANLIVPCAPPKDTIAPNSLHQHGNAITNEERLITLHLARIDRILGSNPSPGARHY